MCEITSLWVQLSRERPLTSRISSPTSKSARSAGDPVTTQHHRWHRRRATEGEELHFCDAKKRDGLLFFPGTSADESTPRQHVLSEPAHRSRPARDPLGRPLPENL